MQEGTGQRAWERRERVFDVAVSGQYAGVEPSDVKVLQMQGQRGTVGGLGSCTHTLQQSPPRTTYHTGYTRRRNQQTRCTAPPECGILVLRSNHGATHRTVGSGRGRAS